MSNTNSEDKNSFDLEASIQISRILKILSDTVKNTEVALCLPLLMKSNEPTALSQFFTPEQVKFITETCKKVSRKTTLEQNTPDAGVPLPADMCLVLDLLFSSPQFIEFCRTKLTNSISPGGLSLLRNLEELRVCVSERLKITPKMEAQQDAELRRIYRQNIRNKEEVEKLTEKLNKLTEDTENEIEAKKQFIKKQIDKIAELRKQCEDSVKKKTEEAEKQINWDIKNSEYRLEELQAAAKNAQYRRETQLKEHLATERDLRTKRYKVESQLAALMQKYDTDIGERQEQLEELTATYEQGKQQLEQLQKEFDEQEADYMNLMMEKEQYEEQQREAKLYHIRSQVAARKIQRAFRAHLAASKSKGKKGKKGKKKK